MDEVTFFLLINSSCNIPYYDSAILESSIWWVLPLLHGSGLSSLKTKWLCLWFWSAPTKIHNYSLYPNKTDRLSESLCFLACQVLHYRWCNVPRSWVVWKFNNREKLCNKKKKNYNKPVWFLIHPWGLKSATWGSRRDAVLRSEIRYWLHKDGSTRSNPPSYKLSLLIYRAWNRLEREQ